MKTTTLFFCLLIAVGARAASPAFSDFNLNQFGTNAGVAGNGVRIKSGSAQSNNVFWASSSAIQFNGSDGTVTALIGTATNFFSKVARVGSSLIISSNTLANLPTLLKGDMAFWSSNGTPYSISSAPDGTLATNALTGGGGSGTVTTFVSTSTGLSSSGNGTATITLTAPSAVVTNGFTPALSLGGTVTSTNSFLFRSNTLASIPTLIKGDVYLWSSNGVPYYIVNSPSGTLSTNAFASGGGTVQNLTVTTTGLSESGNGTATLVLTSPSAVMTNGFVPNATFVNSVTSSNFIGSVNGNQLPGTNFSQFIATNGANASASLEGGSNIWVIKGAGGTNAANVTSNNVFYANALQVNGNGPTTIYGDNNVTNYLNVKPGGVLISNIIGFLFDKRAFYPSNATPSHVAVIGADNTLTNSGLGAVPINGDATATTAGQINTLVGGEILTNGHTHAISLATTFTSPNSNYFGINVSAASEAPTNSAGTSFDFTKLVSLLTTNNAFITTGLSGKDSTGKMMQWATIAVTNSAGLGSAFVTNITFAANTHIIGPTTLNLTNWTDLLCEYWPPNGPTNVFVTPCW